MHKNISLRLISLSLKDVHPDFSFCHLCGLLPCVVNSEPFSFPPPDLAPFDKLHPVSPASSLRRDRNLRITHIPNSRHCSGLCLAPVLGQSTEFQSTPKMSGRNCWREGRPLRAHHHQICHRGNHTILSVLAQGAIVPSTVTTARSDSSRSTRAIGVRTGCVSRCL